MSFIPDRDIPDLSGKVVLVTGGNIGLGRETILQVSKHNPAHIYLAARTKAKAEQAISELRAEYPSSTPITFLELDLSSFESIKSAASKFNASSDRLDILFNNAGVMASGPGLTKEGYEIQFGTNHVGHALFTKLVLPKIKQTAASSPKSDVRIVNLSSSAHSRAPSDTYPFDQLKTDLASRGTFTRYGISKLANIHFTQELAKRNPEIKVVAVHPGPVNTNLSSSLTSYYPLLYWPVKVANSLVTVSVQKGALNQLWAAFSPHAKTGTMYFPVGKEIHNEKIDNEKNARELWEWTETQFKEKLRTSSL